MSRETEFSRLSTPEDKFILMFGAMKHNKENLPYTGVGEVNDNFLEPCTQEINQLAYYTKGMMPWGELPCGYSLALAQQYDFNTMILKMVFDPIARQRMFAVIFALFGNTQSTLNTMQTIFTSLTRYPLTVYDHWSTQGYYHNWVDRIRCAPRTKVPKLDDLDNMPWIWGQSLHRGTGCSVKPKANIWIRTVESKQLFGKFYACKMFPELAEELLKNITKYALSSKSDKDDHERTHVYYNLMRLRYGLPIERLATKDLDLMNAATKIAIASGMLEANKEVVPQDVPYGYNSQMSLNYFYRRLRANVLAANDMDTPEMNVKVMQHFMTVIASVMSSSSQEENALLVDIVNAVTDEGNLGEILETWSTKHSVQGADPENVYDAIRKYDVSNSALNAAVDAVQGLKQELLSPEGITKSFNGMIEMHRPGFFPGVFGDKYDMLSYQYANLGITTSSLIPLLTNKFHAFNARYGVPKSVGTWVFGSAVWQMSHRARVQCSGNFNVQTCENWCKKMMDIYNVNNEHRTGVTMKEGTFAVLSRIIVTDMQHWFRVHTGMDREALLNEAKEYRNPYENLEKAVISTYEPWKNIYDQWFPTRFQE